MRGDFARAAEPAEFLTWEVPGTVRVLFANWAEPTEGGVGAGERGPDRRRRPPGGADVRALEPFIAAFQGLVGVGAAEHRVAAGGTR